MTAIPSNQGTLIITDGTDSVDILNTFHLVRWVPQTARAKGGGVFRSSPFTQGRRLVQHEYENIIDTFDLQAFGGDKDLLIANTQNLRRLLEKAIEYWVTDWQNEPVWIETRGICETNTRYAIIHNYETPNDGNPFDSPYTTSNLFDEWTLILEHGLWLDDTPGTATALDIGGSETYDGRELGITGSVSADRVFVGNKYNDANLTDIYYWDNSAGAWSANLMDAALPFAFMPPAPGQVDDLVIFGIDTSLADSGPFNSLIFNITTAASGASVAIDWLYSDSGSGVDPTGWAALSGVVDHTNTTAWPFDTTGVNSVHWPQPSDWTARNPQVGAGPALGITGYWVCAHLSATGVGALSPPIQSSRKIYSQVWPYIDIDAEDITGDIGALLKLHADYVSNSGGGTGTLKETHRLFVSQRSLDRGTDFSAYINLSQEQNQTGTTLTLTAPRTTYVTNTQGIDNSHATYNPGGAIRAIEDSVAISIDNSISSQYLGRYHVYVRALPSGSPAQNEFGIKVHFYCGLNEANAFSVSDIIYNNLRDDITFDMGIHEFPADYLSSWGDLGILIQAAHTTTDARTLTLLDIILMPVDEWSADIFSDSVYLYSGLSTGSPAEQNEIAIDSITNPRRLLQPLVIGKTSGEVAGVMEHITNGIANVPPNKDVRIWFLAFYNASGDLTPTQIETVGRIMAYNQRRYLGMRGAR